ncbi:MAG: HAMP domain-containing histidine kinase [Alteromonadales bacterium]|nr:HAMP domain-containing histidine kinase [Alteromonadales bacterium]
MKIPSVFKPATIAMSRISFVVKFTLIILIVSLPLLFLSYALVQEINSNISTSKQELKALEVVSFTYKLVYWVADYRDYRLLQRVNSTDNLSTLVAGKKKMVESSLITLESHIKQDQLLTSEAKKQLKVVKQKWLLLSQSKADVQGSVDSQFLRYDKLVQELELLVRVTSYESTLAHDQNPANFYLVNMLLNDIPTLNRELGKLRAYGSFALNLKGINNHTYELLEDVYDNLNNAIAITDYGLQQTKNKLETDAQFSRRSRAVIVNSRKLLDYVYDNIIESRNMNITWNDYFTFTSSGIKVISTLSEKILNSLHISLEKRIEKQQRYLYLILGVAIILYFLITYLVVGVFYSLKFVLEHFEDKAMKLATGKLDTRLSSHSNDELNTLVTVFNNMATQLQDNNTKLIQAEKMASMGRMISGVAHEMNTPLGICITSASFMQTELSNYHNKFNDDELTEEDFVHLLDQSHQTISLVNKNLQRCSSLIETFKQLNSFESISLQEDVELSDLINLACKGLINANSNIEFKLPMLTSLLIDTDTNLFVIVLKNIIDNAIEHGLKNKENSSISISVLKKENAIELAIRDNGEGLDEEEKNKIFDPFYTKHRASGKVGLGMHIVHIIVCQSLKGQIEIISEIGHGTCVKLTLPIKSKVK